MNRESTFESNFDRMLRNQDEEMMKTPQRAVQERFSNGQNGGNSPAPKNPFTFWDTIHRAAHPDISPEKLSHISGGQSVNGYSQGFDGQRRPNCNEGVIESVLTVDRLDQVKQVDMAFQEAASINRAKQQLVNSPIVDKKFFSMVGKFTIWQIYFCK